VNSRGEIFTFFWNDSEETAKVIKKKNDRFIQFKWINEEEDNGKDFFEFKIQVDELTQDVSLIVTDHVNAGEEEEARLLWESQIHELLHTIGS
jgi:hypothetical protein